jgi:hypothetical protein
MNDGARLSSQLVANDIAYWFACGALLGASLIAPSRGYALLNPERASVSCATSEDTPRSLSSSRAEHQSSVADVHAALSPTSFTVPGTFQHARGRVAPGGRVRQADHAAKPETVNAGSHLPSRVFSSLGSGSWVLAQPS